MDARNNWKREFFWLAACAAVIAIVEWLHIYRGIGVVKAFGDIFLGWYIIAQVANAERIWLWLRQVDRAKWPARPEISSKIYWAAGYMAGVSILARLFTL